MNDDEGGRQQIETDEGERDANCKGDVDDGDDGSRDGDSREKGGRGVTRENCQTTFIKTDHITLSHMHS